MRSSVLTADSPAVRLAAVSTVFDSHWDEMATPYSTVELVTVTSTQDEARDRFLRSADPRRPLLVVAEHQSVPRGRDGSSWEVAPRPLMASLALSDPWPIAQLGVIPLVVGLAARTAVRDELDIELGLKWPNDLMVGDDKAGGILVERRTEVVTIGVGLNLWWPDRPDGVGVILDADPGPGLAVQVAGALTANLLGRFESDQWGRDEYVSASVTLGGEITWSPSGRGTAIGIADDGGLIVSTGGSERVLRSGAVRHVRPATLPDRQPPWQEAGS